ncbi:hypothetical protein Pla22_42480 [Rubripirellula amarantea]|uniref:Uncharacterized protein n=1 Tax=Rubripirellula amarantea TaxID=2527999 RepID=A0A5C5WLB1_9BACT|nr:hypothetical protein Pla22_42480 [Rubripirellula amarantea]
MTQADLYSFPEFADKIVGFYCGTAQYSVAIVSPRPVLQAGRLFLTGSTAPREPSGWDDGLVTAIAWDTVSSYAVFDDLDDYMRRMGTPSERASAKPKR